MVANGDIGYVETVAYARKAFPTHPVTPPDASKKHVAHAAADGGLVPTRGEVTLNVVSETGVQMPGMKWQDAPVRMPVYVP